jgi:predicted transcriptional regulator
VSMKYRSRTDIIAMILQAAVHGTTKTRIMYNALLSYAQLKDYLTFLIGKGLIRDDGFGIYTPTQKGIELLRKYEGISNMITLGQSESATVSSPEW